MTDESTVREVGGYLIRVKNGATSPAGISFVLPKDRKDYQKAEKAQDSVQREARRQFISSSVQPWLKAKCEGMSADDKKSFLQLKFGVNSFHDLENLEIKDMRAIINAEV